MPLSNEVEEELIRIGPGTPSGEVFRRYWIPIEVSANLGPGPQPGVDFRGVRNPLRLMALDEPLVLFRDASGKPGLLAEHCSHRGTSLAYGRVEESCIRCIYHGWAYDQEGNVVETPGEPPGSNFKYTLRHPAYPCMEVGGLIFAYMGPKDRMPIFPKYDILFRDDGVRRTSNANYVQQCNVFQALHDNNMDPWHGEVLHGWFKGIPPRNTMHHGANGQPPTPVRYDRTPWGTRMVILKNTETAGKYWYHETHTVWPSQRLHNKFADSISWAIPVDDYQTRWFRVQFKAYDEDGKLPDYYAREERGFNPSDEPDLPVDWADRVSLWEFDHRWRQGVFWEDEIAQRTQGPAKRHNLPDWERWHLATSDGGVVLNRTVWRQQIDRIQEGMDPIGVIRDAKDEVPIRTTADNFYCAWDEGLQAFNMRVEDRFEMIAKEGKREPWRITPR